VGFQVGPALQPTQLHGTASRHATRDPLPSHRDLRRATTPGGGRRKGGGDRRLDGVERGGRGGAEGIRMAAALAPGVSRKLKKVLETRTDNPDLLASLGALSTFYVQNTPQARRNLKSSVEQRGLTINRHFLDASLPAHKALDRVEGEVHALNDSWKKIEEALGSCSASTGDIISTTERLQQELEVITQRQEIVSCFLRDYQLSNEEIHALRDEEIDEKFFKALLHVQEIHSNCKVLLRTHHQVQVLYP
jgi:hypothetical protein